MNATYTVVSGLLLTLALPITAQADEFPFSSDAESEFTKGLEEKGGISEEEKSGTERDRVQVGGNLLSEFYYYGRESGTPSNVFVNPNTLWVYLESQLRDDVRVFAKGRVYYDPTMEEGTLNPLTGLPATREDTQLDEAKLQFNIKNSVFMTVGKQKIKWGSGRFWSPTDFINTLRRDIFFAEDRRAGVSLIKAHVPVGNSNFYYLSVLENANRVSKIGHAVRAELPLESSEFALTAVGKNGRKPVFGADVSTALGDFDVYAEGAFSGGSNTVLYGPTGPVPNTDEFISNVTTGLTYDWKYSDTDTISFGLEYFYNDEGYRSTADYPWVIQSGAYQPFLLGRNYGMFSVYLPNPGSWNDVSFMLLNLGSLSDGSATLRLMTTIRAYRDLTFDVGAGYHYGNPEGELRLGGQKWESFVRAAISL